MLSVTEKLFQASLLEQILADTKTFHNFTIIFLKEILQISSSIYF